MVNRRDAAEESVSRPMMASFAWLRRGELPLSTVSRRSILREAAIQMQLSGLQRLRGTLP